MTVDLNETQAMTLISVVPGSHAKGTVRVSFRSEDGTEVSFHVNRLIWDSAQHRFVKENNEVSQVTKTRRNRRDKKTSQKLQSS